MLTLYHIFCISKLLVVSTVSVKCARMSEKSDVTMYSSVRYGNLSLLLLFHITDSTGHEKYLFFSDYHQKLVIKCRSNEGLSQKRNSPFLAPLSTNSRDFISAEERAPSISQTSLYSRQAENRRQFVKSPQFDFSVGWVFRTQPRHGKRRLHIWDSSRTSKSSAHISHVTSLQW